MSKSVWLLLLLALPAHAQQLSGKRGNPIAKTYTITAQILDEGSFQLQRSGPGLTNWTGMTNFNVFPGTNGFSDTITNAQRFYRIIRFQEPPTITSSPVGVTNFYDQEVRLQASVTGSWPLRFYWYKDGQLVAGASSNVLVFPGRANLSGNYAFAVSNSWNIAISSPVAVKTVNPVATSIQGKKIQYVIKGAQGGFLSSGNFETTYGSLGYTTASPNVFLNDSGQWQYNALSESIGRAMWMPGGFVYPNGAAVDMTFTNLTEGTFNLQVPDVGGRQFGEFKFTN